MKMKLWMPKLLFFAGIILAIYFLLNRVPINEPNLVIDGHSGFRESAISPDGSQLAGLGEDGLRVWKTSDWRLEQEQDYPELAWHEGPFSLAWNPSGTALAMVSENQLIVRNMSDGTELRYEISEASNRNVVWTLSNRIINFGSLSGGSRVQVWNWDETAASLLAEYSIGYQGVAINGEKLAISTSDNAVQIFDILNSELVAELDAYSAEITSLAWANDSAWIAVGYTDSSVRIWDGNNFSLSRTIQGPEHLVEIQYITNITSIEEIQWNFNNTKLAIIYGDATIRIFETEAYTEIMNRSLKTISVWADILLWSPQEDVLAIVSNYDGEDDWYGTAWIWDIRLNQFAVLRYSSPIYDFHWVLSHNQVITSAADGSHSVWYFDELGFVPVN